ncbi:MAG: hypothetical protein HC830_08470 [Bacteroidetes bacterium]|nr:hypothetical protein [Bacteroidota bacterium]
MNIQFSGLFDFKDNHFHCISSYALFSNEDSINIQFSVSEVHFNRISAKETCFLNHSDSGFEFHYPNIAFSADTAVIIAVNSTIVKDRYFVFVNDKEGHELANRIPLFEKLFV